MGFSAVDGRTDYEQGLTATTAFDGIGLNIRLPGKCRLHFADRPPEALFLAGDCFEMRTSLGAVRGAFIDAHHLLIEGPCTVLACDATVRTLQARNRTLVGSSLPFARDLLESDIDRLLRARRTWLESVPVPAALPASGRRTLYKALSVMKTQVFSPEGIIKHRWTTPDRWPHRQMWLWDSAFHAIGWRHVDPALARDMISAVLSTQTGTGFIPLCAKPDLRCHLTQPPVLALAAALVHASQPCLEWIEEIFPKLAAYIEWDLHHRDSDGNGLVEWAVEQHANCRSGESGMDNSPRFDEATRLDAVDFNAFLAHECELLAGFARELGRSAVADAWQGRHDTLCGLINTALWNDEVGFYMDRDVDRQAQSPVLAGSGFLPLICGAPSRAQADRLARHVVDPLTFGTPLRVPTIAARDTARYAKDMWRGPVWINLNWLIAYGFARYGMNDVAQALRDQTMAEIERLYERHGTLFEFYDDRREVDPPALLRKGKCSTENFHRVFFDYGWTTTLYADMVFTAGQHRP
jgi:hypothetical protein